MTTQGRFADFRQSPDPKHRLGRFKTGEDAIRLMTPVMCTDTTVDAFDERRVVNQAAEGVAFKRANSGLIVWEAPWTGFWGHDPVETRASDIDTAPADTPVQVVHGTEVRVVLYNKIASVFQGRTQYPGRCMVKPADLAVLVVGDGLTVGAGGDTTGYYKKTATDSLMWLDVTQVESNDDGTVGFVEAQLRF